MTTDQKVIKTKIGLLELARQPGNGADACRIMGYSRDSFYRGSAGATEKHRRRRFSIPIDVNFSCFPILLFSSVVSSRPSCLRVYRVFASVASSCSPHRAWQYGTNSNR